MQDKTVYAQLAEKLEIGGRKSKMVPLILEKLLDEAEARLVLAAAPPATVEELSAKTGIDAAKVEAMVDPLFRKGVLFKSKKPDAIRYYRVRQVVQLHDSTAVMDNPPPGMFDLWKEYTRSGVAGGRSGCLKQPVLRVVPINVSIESNSQILAFDDVRNFIGQARNIAVTKCSCRAIRRRLRTAGGGVHAARPRGRLRDRARYRPQAEQRGSPAHAGDVRGTRPGARRREQARRRPDDL